MDASTTLLGIGFILGDASSSFMECRKAEYSSFTATLVAETNASRCIVDRLGNGGL